MAFPVSPTIEVAAAADSTLDPLRLRPPQTHTASPSISRPHLLPPPTHSYLHSSRVQAATIDSARRSSHLPCHQQAGAVNSPGFQAQFQAEDPPR